MHQQFKSFVAAALCFCTLTAAIPVMPVSGTDYQTESVSWDEDASLEGSFQSVMNGNLHIYTTQSGTAATGSFALGASLDTSQLYYALTSDGRFCSGKQCYIYAQAVYSTLFDDLPLHGGINGGYSHSEQVQGYAASLSYALLTQAKVLPGAYLRTTANADGSYNGSYGHSMILMGYDENSVTILEGNADGAGLIRTVTMSFDSFNSVYLERKGRVIGHIVQPTTAYYAAKFGYTSPYELPAPPPANWNGSTVTLNRFELGYQLEAPSASGTYTWTSIDSSIASVDQNGVVTAHSNGKVCILVDDGNRTAVHTVTVDAVPWDQLGDLDGSGKVEMLDARYALDQAVQTVSYLDTVLTEEQLKVGDINGDGVLTIQDAHLILDFYIYYELTSNSVSAEQGWKAILNP